MRVSLMGEGNTPLVESVSIGPRLGIHLLFKLEMCNPTGSYKDRFVAAQVTELMRHGVKSCVATSSGNTGAALAAFCGRYRIPCVVFVNEFAPLRKLQQIQAYGARIFRIRDFTTAPDVTQQVYERLGRIARENSIPLVVSAYRYCPVGMRGVESIAVELEAGGSCPLHHVFVPIGGGGLFTAICRGFSRGGGLRPRIHAVQPEGCATVVAAYAEGREHIHAVSSNTRISGLAVPFDIDATVALAELRQSHGCGITVSDAEVFEAQKRMMREEGIWCEPAGAAALAGCVRAREQGRIKHAETVVCLVTGHGLKDPDSLAEISPENTFPLVTENEIGVHLLEVGL